MLSQLLSSAFATNTGWWASSWEGNSEGEKKGEQVRGKENRYNRVREKGGEPREMEIKACQVRNMAEQSQEGRHNGTVFGTKRAWHLSPLFQLITVNPQLAHPSPLSYKRPTNPLCCLALFAQLCSCQGCKTNLCNNKHLILWDFKK